MSRPIRVLLLAPANEIVGGQAVQAKRLLDIVGQSPDVDIRFLPINPRFPKGLLWVKKIPSVRTILTMFFYLPLLVTRALRADILHIFSAGLTSYTLWTIPAVVVGRLLGKRVIINYRDGQAEQHLNEFRSAKPTLGWAHVIVAPSGFIVDVFKKYGIEARSIFNVIDASKFIYRRRSKLRPVIMTNRILEPLYNVECILRAFKRVIERYPEATLTIAHEGPSRASLEQYAKDLGLRNYNFIGKVEHGEIAKLYDAAEIYVTTPNFDCMPGSLLECMASGLPIVTTSAGGIPYIAEDDRTALFAPIDDDEAVARQIFRLLEKPDLVKQLTSEGRRELRNYAPECVREQWLALYYELTARPNANRPVPNEA